MLQQLQHLWQIGILPKLKNKKVSKVIKEKNDIFISIKVQFVNFNKNTNLAEDSPIVLPTYLVMSSSGCSITLIYL